MEIIQAEKKDFNEINKLVENEFPYTKKTIEKINKRINNGNIIFTVKEKNNLVGFIEFKFKDFTVNLLGMAVKKEFRGNKIGKKLLDFLIELCRKKEIKEIMLIVKKNNFTAKKLYEKNGFVKTRELKHKIESSAIEEMKLNFNEYSGVN